MDSTTTVTLLHIRHLGFAPTTKHTVSVIEGYLIEPSMMRAYARVVGRVTLQLTLRFRSRARTR